MKTGMLEHWNTGMMGKGRGGDGEIQPDLSRKLRRQLSRRFRLPIQVGLR